jgi:hypothetical protein
MRDARAVRRARGVLIAALIGVAGPASAAATSPAPAPARAAAQIVVHAKLKSMKGLTATYASGRGTFTATWIGRRHYRLAGRIDGQRLTGSFRTRQAAGGDSYRVSGSGTLGGRSVHITGAGPNDLSRATLVLR